ncbi:hypothetical protein AB6735_22700 [Mucilaginibacter sp. RCC_168]|uniref:HYC_CC_PP family protein n=1 Tax=Mucilaginibacter sp. RCC_168 TaxID=3239221 RepID=UPI003525D05E
MIKRSGALLLTLLYTVTVLGFALNLHYCGTQIASVKIDSPAISCKMDQACGKTKCCKNKQLQIKVKDAHQIEPVSILSKLFGFDVPRLSFNGLFTPSRQSFASPSLERGPPGMPWQNIATFIKNCIFRI